MKKIALIHEWLTTYAGSERVVEQMLLQYPESDLFAVANILSAEDQKFLRGKEPTTSFIQKLPFLKKFLRHYLPLMPMAVEQWDLSAYDVILSSNHAVAKGVICGPDQLHISYVHTPIRYAWEFQAQYLRESKLTWGVRSLLTRMILHYMRLWDNVSSTRVDAFVANSQFIANRIQKCYGRQAEVIYPPVDVDAFAPSYKKEDYYIAASRLVPYKRVDLIVEAFRLMPERKLLVVGDGPMYKTLKANCPANVELMGYLPHERMSQLMQGAKAFVFAAEEDFGITSVEAQACATPVIAYGRGGSLETVVEGVTGCFFEEQIPQSVADAVATFENHQDHFDLKATRQHAEGFRPERFREELANFVDSQWAQFVVNRRRRPQQTFSKTTPGSLNLPVDNASNLVNLAGVSAQ
ncbi:GDP-mannose-dependent alpha-(1-6)-phosphatidylinositol monomannoside mannosyltransferase [Rosistilla carotiformis]|uniref:GDP-mannose-dependent alpha-(1-6)-phosphatidylinositol monomannoside mannosyltransferase n=1 Tax=Rosistilla carotiformis TaxID=2528017 RepID=A0A518K218_9BACT|nr:glycosyltransferase [Rosistilla carotiformis]QDV71805.1 GDP-mannose-dependent alpha-(1-6)-phosphatidylinositol monomannoside mannosyltransferase [Rosistilla carotiformis]